MLLGGRPRRRCSSLRAPAGQPPGQAQRNGARQPTDRPTAATRPMPTRPTSRQRLPPTARRRRGDDGHPDPSAPRRPPAAPPTLGQLVCARCRRRGRQLVDEALVAPVDVVGVARRRSRPRRPGRRSPAPPRPGCRGPAPALPKAAPAPHDGVVAIGADVGAHAHAARRRSGTGPANRFSVTMPTPSATASMRDQQRLVVGGDARVRQRRDVDRAEPLGRPCAHDPVAVGEMPHAHLAELLRRACPCARAGARDGDLAAGHADRREEGGGLDPVGHDRVLDGRAARRRPRR